MAWPSGEWSEITSRATSLGLDLELLAAEGPIREVDFSELAHVTRFIGDVLPDILDSAINRVATEKIREAFSRSDAALAPFDSGLQLSDAIPAIRRALSENDISAYRQAYEDLVALLSEIQAANDRTRYLEAIERVAPSWAESIRRREGAHGKVEPPGDVTQAWRWSVLEDLLADKESKSFDELMDELKRLEDDLIYVTARLVSDMAWASQIERTTLPQRQALIGWMQTIKKIGRGTGKRVPRLVAAAQQLMSQSRTAVPVWIMPVSRVVESFDFSTPLFDVLIIDEASQSDVLAMTTLFLADQV
ncbi:MAG: hypothetical protein IID58_14625, partial [Proteobacteria bacterium]|nr:hypothetical protein [Pseudomonadota bacterium]